MVSSRTKSFLANLGSKRSKFEMREHGISEYADRNFERTS